MDMIEIGLVDKEFEHIKNPTCYCGYDKPNHIEWVRDNPEQCEIICFTERCFDKVTDLKYRNKIKIAWPLEPFVVHAYAYKNLLKNNFHEEFNYILTFDDSFKNNFPVQRKFIWWTPGGSWFFLDRWKMYDKTKNISIVASDKNYAPGHKLRHQVISKYRNKIDFICGKGYKPVDDKIVAFQDFRFQIVIENCRVNNYWTDKLIDCFATGCVPIFWGCPKIGQYFNEKGIIQFENINQLENILNNCNEDLYEKMLPFLKNNLKKARKYAIVEDVMYNQFKEKGIIK